MKYLLAIIAILFAATAQAQEMLGSTLLQRAMYGSEPGIRGINFTGTNGATTTTYETIWPESTVYTFLAANMSSPTISSSSAADDGAPVGTGALTARVTCVDQDYTETTADYILNGQTGVALTQSCMLVNRIEVLTAGTGLTNAGILYVGTGALTSGKPAVVHGLVAAAAAVSDSAVYGVPLGSKLLCTNFYGNAYTTTAGALEVIYDFSVNAGPTIRKSLTGGHNTAGISVQDYIVSFPEKTRLQFLTKATAGTGPFQLIANCMLINSSTNRQF